MTLCAYECSFYLIRLDFELIEGSSIDYIGTYLSMKRDQVHNYLTSDYILFSKFSIE